MRGSELIDGIRRFAKVDDKLFRSGKYNGRGLDSLEKLHNVRKIIDLRDNPKRLLAQSTYDRHGIEYMRIPCQDRRPIPSETIVAAVDNCAGKVLVHCWRGSDRTGAFVFRWRMLRCGWQLEDAKREAYEFGFKYNDKTLINMAGLC